MDKSLTRGDEDGWRDSMRELWSTRLLVFIESAPQSGMYHQILLDPEDFKRVALSIGRVVGEDGRQDIVKFVQSEETYALPDLKQIHEEENK